VALTPVAAAAALIGTAASRIRGEPPAAEPEPA
jgi:hypothetical protein